MLLAFDVGNTNITVGAFEGGRLRRRWRLETDAQASVDSLDRALKSEAVKAGHFVDAAAIASVVPALNAKLEGVVRRRYGCQVVRIHAASPVGLPLRVKRPEEVGADRIANAIAATRLYGTPAVVIDFGTATTFDCVSRKGEYLGGAILPGPRMAAKALEAGTAQLPLVEVRRPRRVIGRDTVECIQGGLYFGYLGMIEKVLELSLAEMGGRGARVIATGGLASLFLDDLPRGVAHDPDLTLQGVRLAYETVAGRNGRKA